MTPRLKRRPEMLQVVVTLKALLAHQVRLGTARVELKSSSSIQFLLSLGWKK